MNATELDLTSDIECDYWIWTLWLSATLIVFRPYCVTEPGLDLLHQVASALWILLIACIQRLCALCSPLLTSPANISHWTSLLQSPLFLLFSYFCIVFCLCPSHPLATQPHGGCLPRLRHLGSSTILAPAPALFPAPITSAWLLLTPKSHSHYSSAAESSVLSSTTN